MAETDSRVLEFLEEGLFLYGVGKVQEAIQRWRKVLELDPRNERALDYIESAGGDVSAFRKAAVGAAPPAAPVPHAVSPSFGATQPGMPAPPSFGATQPGMPAPPSFGATQPSTLAPAPAPHAPSAAPPRTVAPRAHAAPQTAAPAVAPAPAAPRMAPPMPQPPPPTMAPPPPMMAPPPPPMAPPPVARPNSDVTAVSPNQPAAADGREELLRTAASHFRAQHYEVALELLERIAREFPPVDDALRGYLDATRSAVLTVLRGQWSRLDRVPRHRMSPGQAMQLHLSPEAGFLLSRIDGASTLEEILTVSGIEEMTALRALTLLVQNGVIELS